LKIKKIEGKMTEQENKQESNTSIRFRNFVGNTLGLKRFGWRQKSLKTSTGEYREPPIIKQELDPVFTKNNNLVSTLIQTEQDYLTVSHTIFGGSMIAGKPLAGQEGFYSELGQYTDDNVIEQEHKQYEDGSSTNITNTQINYDEIVDEIEASLQRADPQLASEFRAAITQHDTDHPDAKPELENSIIYDQVNIEGQTNSNNELSNPILESEVTTTSNLIGDNEVRSNTHTKRGISERQLRDEIKAKEIGKREGSETLFMLGKNNISAMAKSIGDSGIIWTGEVLEKGDGGKIETPTSKAKDRVLGELVTLLELVNNTESEQSAHLATASSTMNQVSEARTNLLDKKAQNVRFKHTYKVIKEFFREKSGAKRNVFFSPRKNRKIHREDIVSHPHFKVRSWEKLGKRKEIINGEEVNVWTGLDENGFPLEIGDDGIILLDQWMWELGQNPEQMNIIKSKPGGKQFTQKINEVLRDRVRKVDPKFANEDNNPYIDILDMALYIFNEIDAYRDDLRDGRFHPNSKSAYDYTTAADGGFKLAPEYNSKLTHMTIPNVSKMAKAAKKIDETREYQNAIPEEYNSSLPAEERLVTREFRMQVNENIISGERVPSPTNPAFDLRAIKSEKFSHWGRMLYYETAKGINQWSENPFPFMSTRGLAQFLKDRIERDLWDYEDQKRTMVEKSQVGYDYGVRKEIGTSYPKDIIGGSDVVQG
tara:strand:- start:15014 stop:17143 length:2130 start_codon:yes stop_codon:yes gene_type:complete